MVVNVRYFVSDVEKSISFYRDVLGFDLVVQWGSAFAIVSLDNSSQLWLSGPGTSAAKKLKDGSLPQPGGWNRLVIEVKNLDDTMAALVATGASFRSKPIKGPGGRQVLVDDPSGNPIELFEARAEE